MRQPLPAPVLYSYVMDCILTTPSLFAVACSRGQQPDSLLQAAAEELEVICKTLENYPQPQWLDHCAGTITTTADVDYVQTLATTFHGWQQQEPAKVAQSMASFHAQKGFGVLVRHHIWRWQGQLIGVSNPDPIRLTDLVGYTYQKEAVVNNTLLFLQHNKGNNVLLSGERGTGKSSLIKAIANEYGKQGLSLIEVPRNNLTDLPVILDIVKAQPQHYILFIDDLSFDSTDKEYKELKAILEGGVEALSDHILLYATSNRRHLVVETWKDRQETYHDENAEVRMGDTMSEKLSLADRFGLPLTFQAPNQEEYLDIVFGIARREGITLPAEELRHQAINWARWQNAPSGRTARQFINSLK